MLLFIRIRPGGNAAHHTSAQNRKTENRSKNQQPGTTRRESATPWHPTAEHTRCLLGSSSGDVLLAHAHELRLLVCGLEATVPELGRGVDELEGDVLEGSPGSLRQEGLAGGDNPLLGAHAAALDHHEVLHHGTVVGEATHRGDGLLGEIEFSRGVLVLVRAVSLGAPVGNAVDLLVHLGTVEVALLTGTRHGPPNAGRMPRADATNLAQTSVGLAGKLGDVPARDNALVTVTLGHTADVDHLVLGED